MVRNILYSISFDEVLIFAENLSSQTNLSLVRHKISACLTECQTRKSLRNFARSERFALHEKQIEIRQTNNLDVKSNMHPQYIFVPAAGTFTCKPDAKHQSPS